MSEEEDSLRETCRRMREVIGEILDQLEGQELSDKERQDLQEKLNKHKENLRDFMDDFRGIV